MSSTTIEMQGTVVHAVIAKSGASHARKPKPHTAGIAPSAQLVHARLGGMRDIEPDVVEEALEIATTRTVVAELEYVVTPPESGEAVDRAAKVERRAEDLALLADEAAEVTERDAG